MVLLARVRDMAALVSIYLQEQGSRLQVRMKLGKSSKSSETGLWPSKASLSIPAPWRELSLGMGLEWTKLSTLRAVFAVGEKVEGEEEGNPKKSRVM